MTDNPWYYSNCLIKDKINDNEQFKLCDICFETKSTMKCSICTFSSCIDCIKKWYTIKKECPQCHNNNSFIIRKYVNEFDKLLLDFSKELKKKYPNKIHKRSHQLHQLQQLKN